MDSEFAAECLEKKSTSHDGKLSSLEAGKSFLDAASYPENENTTLDEGTFSSVEGSSMDVDNHDNNNMLVLNERSETAKRKQNFDTDEDDNNADSSNRDDPPVKRKKKCLVKSKARKDERRLFRRMTVRKLKKIEDAESSLWKCLLLNNILCSIYEIKHYKDFR